MSEKDKKVDESEVIDVDVLVTLQNDRFEAIKQLFKNFKKDSIARKTKSYCQVRLEKIEFLNKEFTNTHKVIVCHDHDRQQKYFTDKIASAFEESYFDIRSALLDTCEELLPRPAEVSAAHHGTSDDTSSIKLPKLPLPSFSGKYVDWPAFNDSFSRLIHKNSDLNAIQKFHFLKKALAADKDVDVHQMALTETNYETAWDLIVKRYDNPRLLFMHHMNKLFSLPAIAKERSDDIKSLLNTASVCINEFKRLKLPISACNQWIAYFLSTKLPQETHKAWELHLGSDNSIPTFESIESFLNNRLVSINVIENRNVASNANVSSKNSNTNDPTSFPKRCTPQVKGNNRNNRNSFHVTAQTKNSRACHLCNEGHILRRCPTFLIKDCFERKSIADKAKLCINCLSASHTLSQCSSSKNCLQCGQRHHTLLHFPTTKFTQENETTPSASVPLSHGNFQSKLNQSAPPFRSESWPNQTMHSTTTNAMSTHTTQLAVSPMHYTPRTVLLATALVKLVNDVTGQDIVVRALLDQGSECTLISEHAVQAIGLSRVRTSVDILGVGSNAAHRCKYTVGFRMQSCVNSFHVVINHAFVLNRLTSKIPNQTIKPQQWSHIIGLQLADPMYYQSRRVDLLIGADMFAYILLPETRMGRFDEPIAQHTHLGWILSGNATAPPQNTIRVNCHHVTLELESLVQRFFELDQVPEEHSLTDQEMWCEKHFQQTHTRQPNGKYLVRLPLKHLFDESQTLGRSKQIALNRFSYLERKLQRYDDLRTRYEEGIREYFILNQIRPAVTTKAEHCIKNSANKPTVTSCVLPHHAIFKEDSVTTKLRIVFDASCKTTNGKSLNDILCVGPALHTDLPAVILNWRKHKFAFTADIQKMYRCIDMHIDDAQYQRILWRNADQQIQEYCLTTVTFGTASAPFTAIRVLHQLAEDGKASYPLAAHVLKNEVYVDDILSGSHSLESAMDVREQLTSSLRSAGMELRKWSSNQPALLDNIPHGHMSNSNIFELSESSVKTLGMCWQPNNDFFSYKLNFELDYYVTKRSVLSTIARLFDPLGLIAPVIVAGKIILKSVWCYKVQTDDKKYNALGWDEVLPKELNNQWKQFLDALSTLHCIKVSRWLQYDPIYIESLQLHAFCDGSTSAYASCVYLRVKFVDTKVYTTLLMAKSRVTPTKPLTIPRVELSGAVLATELIEWINRSFSVPNENLRVSYWTDATIVLYWINGDPNRWQTWVSNRVVKILKVSVPRQWSHVDTHENPADCATRGLTPAALSTFDLWWSGPKWLRQSEDSWPTFIPQTVRVNEEEAEIKRKQIQVNLTICEDSVILRYSSLNQTLRVCAYILRFLHNSRIKDKSRTSGPLTVIELNQSLTKIIFLVQREAFSKEMHCVRTKTPLPTGSKLRNLSPFLDEFQVLRVRGRIQRSNLPFKQKHPIILPSSHHITNLVIVNAHITTLHGGAQLTKAYLRKLFWIVNEQRVVQQQLRKCITCIRINPPEVVTQLMGNLPFHRVNPPRRPFLATGIDYTGAIDIKSSKFRGNTTYKGYIAVFICLATKCIHLEAVTGMSTENFLWALQRFIGRRGICKDIYSDCGTNFIGADKVLQTSQRRFAEAIEQDIVPKMAIQGIQWHFNPPHSPNFGGLWESNVKSVKHHLKRVMGSTRLTYEALSTLLVRIESCLNSRPLCPLTSDPNDLMVLTPGHFLVGDSLLSPPESLPAANISLSQQFIQTQRMLQNFWKQWTSDWLSHLQTRPKWFQQQANLQLNDLVIVKDDRLPPNEWVMARIIDLHPGPDNLVRVVTIRTQHGTYKRPISKLCLLPIPTHTQEK